MSYITITLFPGISREIPVFPTVPGNTLISRLFDNPVTRHDVHFYPEYIDRPGVCIQQFVMIN